MKITTDQVRQALALILSEFDACEASEWIISKDYYWEVSADERYDPTVLPKEPTLGQLSDDLSRIIEIAEGKKPPVAPALIWLSSILRFAGEKGLVGIKEQE